MDTGFLKSYFPVQVKNIAAGAVLLLLTVLVSSYGDLQPGYKTTETAGPYKNEPQPRMFLITVVDSNDDSIGRRCEKDLDEIIWSFEGVALWLNMDLEDPKIIKGDQFSKAAVNDAIDDWLTSKAPTGSDVVVFYYSGHGFRYSGDASEYPRMWLKTSDDKNTETANLGIEDIYDRIVNIGAGVNIVLSDCCNTSVTGNNEPFDEIAVPVRKRTTHKRVHGNNSVLPDDFYNAKQLFIPNQPLSIIATAAAKGEFAGGKSETGGFFTNYFLEALEECIYENRVKPTWANIFKYADENAGYWARSADCPQAKHNAQGRCIQTAQYKIDLPD